MWQKFITVRKDKERSDTDIGKGQRVPHALIKALYTFTTALVAQMVKHLPTVLETWVQSLGWEDLLEKEMATHSSIFVWKIPWTEKSGRLQSMGSQRVGHD